jgi:hypothetical protein
VLNVSRARPDAAAWAIAPRLRRQHRPCRPCALTTLYACAQLSRHLGRHLHQVESHATAGSIRTAPQPECAGPLNQSGLLRCPARHSPAGCLDLGLDFARWCVRQALVCGCRVRLGRSPQLRHTDARTEASEICHTGRVPATTGVFPASARCVLGVLGPDHILRSAQRPLLSPWCLRLGTSVRCLRV